MNIPLLRQIQAQIIQHPETLYMPTYDCGTGACIAGWACRLCFKNEAREDNFGVAVIAQGLIDLTGEQRGRLFCEDSWPKQYAMDFADYSIPAAMRAVGSKARAKAAVARIDHFIATNGEE